MQHVRAFALKTYVRQLLPRQESLGTSQQRSQTASTLGEELLKAKE